MVFLINFYNQRGAGPKNIAINFINEVLTTKKLDKFIILVPNIKDYQCFISTENVKFLRLSYPESTIMKALYRIYLELFLIPILIMKYNVKSLLAFGNFLFAPVRCKKTVLLHHPYLVDDQLFKKLGRKSKFNELLKRIAFSLTTKNTETIVVQSDYMKRQLETKHGKGKFLIKVIPNPISKSFDSVSKILNDSMLITRVEAMSQTLDLLYVSRFNPHKNHRFLIEVSKKLNCQNINHRILVTVDPLIFDANNFLIDTVGNGVSIINLTELEQAQLIEHYQNAHLFIFPSSAETFGNPLIEAMCYGLPILVPNLEYARSIIGDAGTYYHEDDVEDCIDQVKSLINDPDLYLHKSKQSLQQFKSYPTTTEWFGQYMTLIK